MRRVIEALLYWLARSNLKAEGVELVLRFPSPRERSIAENAMRSSLTPDLVKLTPSGQLTIDGVPVRFEARPWGQD